MNSESPKKIQRELTECVGMVGKVPMVLKEWFAVKGSKHHVIPQAEFIAAGGIDALVPAPYFTPETA